MCRFFLLLVYFSALLIFNAHAESQNNPPTSAVKRPSELNLASMLAELAKTKKTKDAIFLLETSLKNPKIPPQIIYWHLAKLARESKNSRKWRKYINNIGPSPLSNNNQLIAEIYQESSPADQKWLNQKLRSWGFFEPEPTSSCPFFELDKRKKRALLLFTMLGKGVPEEAIFQKFI